MEGVLYPGKFISQTNNDNLVVENPNLKQEKITKRKVIAEMRKKLEETKLSIIKIKFEENEIIFPENITTIKDLEKKLKKTRSELEYNRAHSIIQSVSDQFNATVNSLEEGSKTAFNKLMTSRVTTSIAKSLGISLTGRTLLILAPTLGTKALVAGGMGAYYVINSLKNKKSVKEANISNEINNILLDLEATKDGDKYLDTRFNEECQDYIKQFLNENNIYYTYTGYRSLISTVYQLNDELKLKLVKELNIKLARGEEIDKRIQKAQEKLNVIAATATTVGVGLTVGKEIANTVNDIDPTIGAIPISGLTGSFLGNWLSKITGKSWIKKLTTGVAAVGTAVFGFLGIGKKVFAVANNIIYSSAGTLIGVAAGPILSIISTIKDIAKKYKLNKKFKEYNKLDAEKYAEDDAKELELMKQQINDENNIEKIVLNITLGFIKDNGINLNGNPQNIKELNQLIEKLPKEEKRKTENIVKNINDSLLSNMELFKENIKKVTNITGTLVLSGFSALSIYDLIKGGTFLPELSNKIWKKGNMNIYGVTETIEDLANPNLTMTSTEITKSKQLYEDILNLEKHELPEGIQGPPINAPIDKEELAEYFNEHNISQPQIENLNRYITYLGDDCKLKQKTIDSIKSLGTSYLKKDIEEIVNNADISKGTVYQQVGDEFSARAHTGNFIADGMNANTAMQSYENAATVTFVENVYNWIRKIFGKKPVEIIERIEYLDPQSIQNYLESSQYTIEDLKNIVYYLTKGEGSTHQHAHEIVSVIETLLDKISNLYDRNKTIANITTGTINLATGIAATQGTLNAISSEYEKDNSQLKR